MLGGQIAGITLFWADLALAGDAALELRLQLFAGALFKGVSATDRENGECNRDQDRQGPHPLIL